jgi:hypothetical protein
MTGFIDPLESHAPDSASATPDPDQPASDERDRIRELVLLAHPEVVPELVQGASIGELLASIEPARSAYRTLAERIQAAAPPVASVPAGGSGPAPLDLDRLPAAEKLRRGLAELRKG